MKILRLETRNLASLEGDNVIEFETGALGATQIFSIVGPTGSGKSTILDAICLALYGVAPRYPLKKRERGKIDIIGNPSDDEKNRLAPSDPRNILTNGQKDGYSKLTFLANDGQTYRAEWIVRKKVKNYDVPQKNLIRIDHDANGHHVETTCDWENLVSILGLGYEQFVKTVLIAQGNFANFLNAEDKERMELLEKLVGNEDFYVAFYKEVKERTSKANQECSKLESKNEAYKENLLTPEDKASLEDQLAKLLKQSDELKAQLKAIDNNLKWYDDDDQLANDIKQKTNALENAQTQFNNAEPRRARLALRDATHEAVELSRNVKSAQKAHQDAVAKLANLDKSIADITLKLKQSQATESQLVETATKATDNVTTWQPHIEEAKKLTERLKAYQKDEHDKSTALGDAKERLNKASGDLEANKNSIAEEASNEKKANEAIDKAKQTAEAKTNQLTANLGQAQKSYDEANARLQPLNLNGLNANKSRTSDNLSDAKECIKTLTEIKDGEAKIATNNSQIQDITEDISKCNKEISTINLDALENEVEILRQTCTLLDSENLSKLRGELVDGQPCPLCGAVHHPYALSETVAEVSSKNHKLLTTKKEELDKKRAQHEELNKRKTTNDADLKNLTNANEELVKTTSGKRAQLNETFVPKHPDWQFDAEWLTNLLPQLTAADEAAQKALSDYDSLNSQTQALRNAKEKANEALNQHQKEATEAANQLNQALINISSRLATLREQTPKLQADKADAQKALDDATAQYTESAKDKRDVEAKLQAELQGRDSEQFEAQLKKAQSDAAAALETHRQERQKLEQDLSSQQGSRQTMSAQCDGAQKTLTSLQTSLSQWIEGYNAAHNAHLTEAEIASLAADSTDWEALRASLETIKTALTEAQTTLKNANDARATHSETRPADTREVLQTSQQQLNTDSKSINEQANQHRLALLKDKETREAMGAMLEDLNAARLLSQNWKEISDAIGGEGKTLRKMVQCYTLGFLVSHANRELRRFNKRYELQQVKNSLGLRIIDHDRAGEVRETTSLSGGETFIVSLGLALGLSSLSSRNVRFDNFFIDEGFGTLDPDTLAIVIDALSTLQSAQGKKVGVISHTETMSERISTQIRVIKEGASGRSRIKVTGGEEFFD